MGAYVYHKPTFMVCVTLGLAGVSMQGDASNVGIASILDVRSRKIVLSQLVFGCKDVFNLG